MKRQARSLAVRALGAACAFVLAFSGVPAVAWAQTSDGLAAGVASLQDSLEDARGDAGCALAPAAGGALAPDAAAGGAPAIAATWDGSADTSWYNASAKSFTLSTPAQVAGLARIASGTAAGIAADTFAGKAIVLGADLTLNAAGGKTAWTPIADINIAQNHATATNVMFDGTFDGAGHKVYGLYIPMASENYGGYHAFFGSLGPHAVVKGLGIESGTVAGRVAAGIAAVSHVDDTEAIPQIIGCYNRAEIIGNGATSRGSGGIFAGENQKGDEGNGEGYRAAAYIADCYNTGAVHSSGPCGGIAGTGSVKMYGCYNAGMVYSTTGGSLHGSLMADLFMKGSVTAAKFQGAGVIANSYAYEGTDSVLYRILDADHVQDEPAYPSNTWGDPYYNETTAFLDAQQMDEGSYYLGTAYVDDDSSAPKNNYLPLLWWQAGKASIDIAASTVQQVPNQLYTGSEVRPAIHVWIADPNGGYESIELNEGSDYRVVFQNNKGIGRATATVYGVGRYEGSAGTVSFNIVQIDLSKCTIDPISPQWFYGGEARPAVTVRTPDDTTLWEGEDYTVAYADNTATGKATVTITGNGRSTTGVLVDHFYLVMASDHLEGQGTEESPYLLSSKADLQFLSHAVNTDQAAYVDRCYRLTCDIDASAADDNDLGIDPIGVNLHPFAGTFDGAGHAITLGMDASRLSDSLGFSPLIYDYLGLFSCTGSAGTTTIRNLTLKGTVASPGTAAAFIGSAVDSELVMTGCRNEARVTARSGIGSGAAGFIGVAAGTKLHLEDCVNAGKVNGPSNASGIVVYLNGGSGQHVFEHCGNEGAVSASESAAGIIQHYAPTSRSSFLAENCYNTGPVTSTRSDGGAAGGILGMVQSGESNASIDRTCSFLSCYNGGTVNGGRHAGGIAGQIYTTPMTFTGCYNAGAVNDNSGIFGAGGICGAVAYRSAGWTFTNCYNVGTVRGTSRSEAPGGIVGYCFAGSQVQMQGCYYLEDAALGEGGIGKANEAMGAQKPVVVTGEAEAKTSEQMKARGTGGFAASLGSIFADDDAESPLNGGYPVCYWQLQLKTHDMSETKIATIPAQEYCGSPVKVALDVTLSDGEESVKLIEDVDYTTEYEGNLVPGQAKVTLTGIGRYTGSCEASFTITKGAVGTCEIGPVAAQWCTDTGAEPELVVTNAKGNVLARGTDYTVEYSNNQANGTATAKVVGAGYYEGDQSVQFTVVKAAESLSGAGTKSDPYVIGTVPEFAYFMAKVNAGEGSYPFACYRLSADLDLKPGAGQPAIDPVGTARNRFRGLFDGAGRSVNLNIDKQGPYLGMFGVVDGATITDLVTTGEVKQTVEQAGYGEETLGCVGAVVGYSFDSLHVKGCTNKAKVSSNGAAVAGLVGIADAVGCTVELDGCRNEGAIESDDYLVAGLLGDVRAGRLVVRGCSNAGAIDGADTVAGLVGRPGGSVSAPTSVVVTGSYNTGAIEGRYRSGGLLGSVYSYVDVTIRNCFNSGDICSPMAYGATYLGSGTGANGGLVGGIGANSGLTVNHAYNAGALSSDDATLALGGVAGYVNSSARAVSIAHTYFAGSAKSVGNQLLAEGVEDSSAPCTQAALKGADMPAKLGDEFGYDAFGANGGYPVLGSQRVDIATCGISPVNAQTYTGSGVVPAVTLYDIAHKRNLEPDSDYQVVCEDNVDVGRATAHIVGVGTYTGEVDVQFDIEAANLADCTLADIPDQPRTGAAVTPALELSNEHGVALVQGVDYTVGFSNNVEVGTARAVVRGKGNYTGILRASFQIIEQTDISQSAVIEPIADAVYTGKAIEPSVEVSLDGVPMVAGSEYEVSYENNVEPGTATAIVTGKGAFRGSVRASFTILPTSLKQAIVAAIPDVAYTGKAICPEPTVTLGGKTLVKDRDYRLSYSNNVNAGRATVTVTGAGVYTGSVSAGFTIKPASVSIVVDQEAGDAGAASGGLGSATGGASGGATAGAAAPAAKAANPMKVSAKAKTTVRGLKLWYAKQVISPIKAKGAAGKVTFSKVSKGSSEWLSVNKKTGKVTVKKRTPIGTYKLKVKVKAAGDATHKQATKTVTVKVKVKW